MAEKQTKNAGKQTSEDKKEQMAKARAARESQANLDVFTANNPQPADKKLPPQAQGIVNILIANGPTKRAELTKAMEGIIVTRQPMGRILTYYQKRLEQDGFVTITKAAAAAKKETASE